MSAGWFSIAVHAVALVARSPDGYPSAVIASSLNTHPVFTRRVLSSLVKGGLLETSEGRGGGYRLTRPAGQITLADIYRAMDLEAVITPSPADPNPTCEVGAGIRLALGEVTTEAEAGLLQVLDRWTVAELSERAVTLGRGR